MTDMRDETKIAQAIEELQRLAFQYARKDDEVTKLKSQLNTSSYELSKLGKKLADAHDKHKCLLGRLNNNLTVQSGPFIYQFEIDCEGVTKFVCDTAI